jgi:hypothetical protein
MSADATLPECIADISIEWLRQATHSHTPFVSDPIESFKSRPVGSGIGQMGEFALIDAELASGATQRLFAKWQTPVNTMNEVARTYRMYEREVLFYQQLASRIPTRTPQVYFAHYDHERHRVGLLMESFDGWQSPDQITGASRAATELALDQLVPITTSFWNSDVDLDWIPTTRTDYMRALGPDYRACSEEFLSRYRSRLPSNVHTLLGTIGSAYERLSDHLADGHRVLTHYDYRVENMFFSPNGRELAVVDWQLVMWMRPGWDFAYLLCTSVTVENRRTWFAELADRYFAGLHHAGIPPYSKAEFDHDLRAALCGLTAISVIGGANADTDNARSIELFAEIAGRAFTAVNDLDALAALP